MKILVIKYSQRAFKAIERIAEGDFVMAVCDPDLNGRLLAHHDIPALDLYADPSKAIRDSRCDAVLLTISDHAAPLALLAMAYKKTVLLSNDIDLGIDERRVFEVARQTNTRVGWL